MVPALTTGLVRVLWVKVSDAVCVTITPVLGKVAEELMPVPPFARANRFVTAADWDRSMAPKDGTPPPLGTIKL